MAAAPLPYLFDDWRAFLLLLSTGLVLFVLMRFGLVALAVAWSVSGVFEAYPIVGLVRRLAPGEAKLLSADDVGDSRGLFILRNADVHFDGGFG